MSNENWYYVDKGERKGPFTNDNIIEFIKVGKIGPNDYLWIKGFENWKKLKEIPQLKVSQEKVDILKFREVSKLSTLSQNKEGPVIYIRTGFDREGKACDYGPFNFDAIKELHRQSRINGKTLLFIKGMESWKPLGEFEDYEEIFAELPPEIQPQDLREFERRPFMARMFFHDNLNLYEGLCRDISLGGMQVLVASFPGKEGDTISMNVHPENSGHHFIASGKVVRVLEGGQGFSFKFIDLSEDAKNAIESYIDGNNQ